MAEPKNAFSRSALTVVIKKSTASIAKSIDMMTGILKKVSICLLCRFQSKRFAGFFYACR
jgi:hypothetical protein